MANGSPDYIRSLVAAQEQKIKALHLQNHQKNVAIGSMSTLAANYKTHLETLVKILNSILDEDSLFYPELKKAEELLAMPHNQPVDQILVLLNQNQQMRGCVAGYQTQQEHMEARIRELEQKLAERK